MKEMQTEHVEYLRDLMGRRGKRLSGKCDAKSKAEGALCLAIGMEHFGLVPEPPKDTVIKAKTDKPVQAFEDRSHRLAPAPEKRKVAPAQKPKVEPVAKKGPVAASPKPAEKVSV
jgi:hypothetical protein